MTREKALELFKKTLELKELILKMRNTAMELLTHPDATANQVMRVQQKLVEVHRDYRERLVVVDKAIGNFLPAYSQAYNLDRLKL